MNAPEPRSTDQLLEEIEQLRIRLDEAEQTLAAIRGGEVDALVLPGPHGDQIFTLAGAEHTYRVIVETMYEAALTVDLNGSILFCNQRFCDLVRAPMQDIIGQIAGMTGNGEEALVMARQQHPDLVLMDIRLSGPLDGIKAASGCGSPSIASAMPWWPVTLNTGSPS